MKSWKEFIDSLGSQGGGIFILACLLVFLYPLLLTDSTEGWKAAMFVLGAIVGIINSGFKNLKNPEQIHLEVPRVDVPIIIEAPPPPPPPKPPTDPEITGVQSGTSQTNGSSGG